MNFDKLDDFKNEVSGKVVKFSEHKKDNKKKKKKHNNTLIGLGVFLLVISGGWGIKNLFDNFRMEKTAEVFVTENIWDHERKDLETFFNIWQRAYQAKLKLSEYREMIKEGKGRFVNSPVMQVEQETIYGDDINNYFLIYYFYDYVYANKIPERDYDKVMSVARQESEWLQEAASRGEIELDSSFFNSNNKDYELRGRMVNKAKNSALR